jgi:hypothetical protein
MVRPWSSESVQRKARWIACKSHSRLHQFKLRGTDKVSGVLGLHVIAFNLIRLGNLLNPAMKAA